jgi:hypothetical protein
MITTIRDKRQKGGEDNMATNPPKGAGRQGAVRDREQVYNSKINRWIKQSSDTGRFMDQKIDGKPFKGVRKNSTK